MRALLRTLLLALALFPPAARAGAQVTAPPATPSAQSCAPAKTALVLAGGAAKGFAHVGVLQVLDSLGIKPDLIVGTSVGAMVGSLYASGYTARQVDSMMIALPFSEVIRQYEPMVSSSLGLLKPLAVWERGRTGYRLQTGAAREGEVNGLMSALALKGNVIARGRFDALPIPFRAVATDLVTGRAVVIGTGDLALAVRASIALPLIFQPVRSDSGVWLIDGALSANAAVAQARALGAERVWVSRLPYAPPDRDAFDNPFTLVEALVNTLFKEDSTSRRPGDVNIVNPTYAFEPLDFRRETSDSLIRLGREAARKAFATASCVAPLHAGALRNPALPLRVRSVTISTGVADGEAALAGLGVVPDRPFDLRRTEAALVQLGHSERLHGVWLNPTGTASDVDFRPQFLAAPRRSFGVGVAFDQFMSGRLWIGGVDRSLFGANAEGAVIGRFGTYAQDVVSFVRLHADVPGRHIPVTIGGRLAHESVRLFNAQSELTSAETNEGEGFVGLRQDPQAGQWRSEIVFAQRLWREPGRGTRGSPGLRAAIFHARDEYEMGTIAEAVVLTDYQRVRVDASRVWDVAGLQARVRIRAGWGNRLPLQQTFTLGGADGFAGLRIGEDRGSQEAYTSLQLKRRIAAQLKVVMEGMAGAIGTGHGFLTRRDSTDFGRIYGGVRVGIEAASPIGPIRIEEGFANTGKRALLVRVGYWF